MMEGERDGMEVSVRSTVGEEELLQLSVIPKVKRSASPRWSKHETLVMIEAKRKHELDLFQANALKGGKQALSLTDVNKWDYVSASCRAVGIDRDGKMCRKRWFNLLTEFKKILEWCRSNGVDEFWNMSGDERREKRLPTGFDQEVYLAMETSTKSSSGIMLMPDHARLFSEIDHDVQHLENGPFPLPVASEPLLITGMVAPVQRPRNLKRRNRLPSASSVSEEEEGGDDDPLSSDPYVAMLESTSKRLQSAFTETMHAQLKVYNRTVHAQIEALKQENALERALRKEQGDKLIAGLATLVDTLSKIADKM